MRKEIIMENSFGVRVCMPLTFAFIPRYLYFWSNGFNYMEIWK